MFINYSCLQKNLWRFRPHCTGVDPSADGRDLFLRQLRPFGWHALIRVLSAAFHNLYQQAVFTVAGNDWRLPGGAGREREFTSVQAIIALVLQLVVAFDAVALQDWPDTLVVSH